MLDFIEKLSSADQDLLTRVLNDVIQDAAPGRVERISTELERVRQKVNKANRFRQRLGSQVSSLEKLIDVLGKMEPTSPSEEVVITALRSILVDKMFDLKVEIETLRPDEMLEKKFSLKTQMMTKDHRRAFGQSLIQLILSRKEASANDGQ